MIDVTLYSRKGCHLCDDVRADLEALRDEIPHRLYIVDIDEHKELQGEYGENIPVVKAGPYHLKAPISRQDLVVALKAAQHRVSQIAEIDQAIEDGRLPTSEKWTSADRVSLWLSRHYLAFFNIFVFLYVGLPFLAPVMMRAGWTGPASLIYRGYNAVCHELAFRSWFLFGEQPAYPRSIAGVDDWLSYGDATGMNEDDLWAARSYVGNENVGFKVALCQRDIAIYGGILLFGVLFALTGRKFGSLHWLAWLILGILPIGLDGVSQLISQPPLNLLPYRESTPMLRTLTGALFGFMTAWFGYPLVDVSMRETGEYLGAKFKRTQNAAAMIDAAKSPASQQSDHLFD